MDANELPAPPFTNAAIDPTAIPRLADVEFTALDPKLLTARITTTVAVGATALLVTIALAVTVDARWSIAALVVAALVATAVVLERIGIAHMGYAVRQRDFSFRSGVIGRSVATVPFARVQHVTLESGPLERHFGLSTLELRTAGESISVPGLRKAVAEDLKGLVVSRSGELADAEHDPDRLER